jgi:hypothetical protein
MDVLEKIYPPEVLVYRVARFLDLGFEQHDADLLVNTRADLHRVRRMMAGGCDIELAIRILL